MPILYADVVVDISAGNLDKVFQYRIPEHLVDILDIGMQVAIPFGKGNRQITGYVVNISGQTDYDPMKIKEIVNVVNGEIALENQLIRLAWQIRKVYGGTMNQALKTVIPVKRQVRDVVEKYYVPSISYDEARLYMRRLMDDLRYKTRVLVMSAFMDAWNDKNDLPTLSLKDLQSRCGASKAVLSGLIKDGILKEVVSKIYRNPSTLNGVLSDAVVLNEQQQAAADDIWFDENHSVHVLHGITGSGKTEVYMELIARTIASGGQAILLIPEIALSLQTVMRLQTRFGNRVSVMNSRLSEGEKYDQYLRAKRGEVDVVVGPRSALFMPFEHLKLIIIDEEHDGSFKSENTPKFHARDVAMWRAQMCGAKLVLGSATPSLETYARALSGMYGLHELTVRAKEGSQLPKVHVVDLREEFKLKNKKIFSTALREKIEERLAKKEQIILFLNRRGFAGFVSCRSCGHVFKCKHCEVSLTSHYGGILKCHYCGYEQQQPKICPECGSPYVAAFGTGTQKVEQMIMDEFPQAKVLRLDRDSTAKKDSMEDILNRFRNGEADILVGTQMIVKGHDFPNVTLVGILAADLSMFSNDYMAAERTFDLLTQAAGRSGRAGDGGEVVIQTYNPEHYSIVCAAKQDYKSFYKQEMLYRKMLHYPPVMHMLVVLVQSADEPLAEKYIRQLLGDCKIYAKQFGTETIHFVGPANASISKGKDTYRKVFYIKSKKFPYLTALREFMEKHLKDLQTNGSYNNIMIQFDVNPMSMY